MSLNSDLNIILQIKKDIYNSINEKKTPVSSSVSFDEYPSILDSFAEKRCKILKIVPTPVDSTVTFDKTSFQNQAATALNGTISYTVSKEGYGTVSGTVVMDESKVLDVVLKKYYTFSKSYSTSDSITFPEDAFDIIVGVVGRGGDCGTRYTSGSKTYYGGNGGGGGYCKSDYADTLAGQTVDFTIATDSSRFLTMIDRSGGRGGNANYKGVGSGGYGGYASGGNLINRSGGGGQAGNYVNGGGNSGYYLSEGLDINIGKGAGVPKYKAKAGAIIITYKYYNTVA